MKITKLLFLFLLPLFSFSQMTEQQVRTMARLASEPELIIESSRLVQEERLYHAEIIVDRLLQMQPNSANYNYRKGYLLLTSHNEYVKAIEYFTKALTAVSEDHDIFSITDTSSPIEVHYYLANCYHLDEQLEKAKAHYTNFFNLSKEKSDLVTLANLQLIQCEVAEKMIANPKKTIIKNIGNVVNTEYAEYSPVISLDGEALYFTSRRPWEDGSTNQYRDPLLNNFPEDIYVSYKDKTKNKAWTPPTKLSFCEGQRNEATIAVSPDERRIYVYQDNTGGGDIFYSDFNTNSFQQVQPFDIKDVNSKSWETHVTATTDGLNMYFVSDRPGGLGGRDIYRIVKLPDGSWSAPKNLGPTINTPYDEDAPFIGADNKTLYYSSNGPESMGGFDIFYTIRDENNAWSIPINLGYPINSTGDDVFFTTTIDGSKGYFSSFRKNGFGEKDIYEINNDELGVKNIAALRGIIKTAYNKPFPTDISLAIHCKNCDNTTDKIVYPRLRDGTFFNSLESCRDYEVTYFYENGKKEFYKESFSTSCTEGYDEIYRDFLLDADNMKFINLEDTVGKTYDVFVTREVIVDNVKVKETETIKVELGTDLSSIIAIEPIYFDLNKFNIRPDAATELDKIVKIMNENPKMVIELGSHTDCRASAAYNMQLSANRAKASAAYIKKRITNPKRVTGKGYGESQLKNNCNCEGDIISTCSEAEHQLNRRTEFIIVKMK
jgi:outer membrane protein OmpA-like peptidoglycan-associated protein/tetratricopeptide (TPR) repeat protein